MLFLWTFLFTALQIQPQKLNEWNRVCISSNFLHDVRLCLQSNCTNFHTNSAICESSNSFISSFKKYYFHSFSNYIISVHLSSGALTHSLGFYILLEISSSDFLNFVIVLNSKMSICFLFIISTFHLRFTILSFITSTFSFVILITLHLHSFVIISPSGISQLIFFSFDSNTIFLVPLMLSNLGVYAGQWENCMVENLDSVIFFWKAFIYCLANNYID